MVTIEEYLEDPLRARIDVLQHPYFQALILPEDIETITMTQGAAQVQVQALKLSAISSVFQRAVAAMTKAGANFRDLVCSSQEFNFCHVLKNSAPATAIQQLDTFLKQRLAAIGVTSIGVAGVLSTATPIILIGQFVTLLLALAHIRRELEKMCQCPP